MNNVYRLRADSSLFSLFLEGALANWNFIKHFK